MTLQPGHTIEGKYRIVRLLGKGAMGAVYEGENERIRRRVAIKVLHSEASHNADVVQRFEREAQAAGRIGSAHIVEVLDLGNLFTGERFMVMEYLDGESLGARLKKQERMAPQELAPMLHQLLEGLASAHEAGIVHRDLKPDNIYLVTAKNQQNFVKILDFGVSKFTAGTAENDLAKTNTGMILGTPYYMSPEQVRAESLDARSDVYSIGVIMYQAVTGKLPFRAGKFTELAMKITVAMYDPPESVTPGLDPQFTAIITKAMHHDRKQRFQTAREFQAAIEQWMSTNAVALPGMTRMHSLPPTSLPPGLLLEAQRASQPHGPSSRSSISGGVVVNQQQLSSTHVTPMGTSNSGLGISQPAPAPTSNGLMIAVGLFGTLFVAVCAVLVYTFVIDKPASATPTQASSATVAATAPPPPPPVTQTAAPQVAPTTSPSSSADAPPASIEDTDTQAASKSTGGSTTTKTTKTTSTGTKPPPSPNTGGRKMTGEL